MRVGSEETSGATPTHFRCTRQRKRVFLDLVSSPFRSRFLHWLSQRFNKWEAEISAGELPATPSNGNRSGEIGVSALLSRNVHEFRNATRSGSRLTRELAHSIRLGPSLERRFCFASLWRARWELEAKNTAILTEKSFVIIMNFFPKKGKSALI